MTTPDHLSAAREALSRMTPEELSVSTLVLTRATTAGIVVAVKAARFWASEATVEEVARELAYQLGDTMGDARPVFLSSEMHQNGENWRRAARAVLALIAQAGMAENGG